MISVQQAQRIVLKYAKPRHPRKMSLGDVLGLVLAKDISAATELPSFTNSAMDGYALRFSDTKSASTGFPISFRIAEYLPAGKIPSKKITAGTCAQIMTGALLPQGADAVIAVEETEKKGNRVIVRAPIPCSANIRYRGEDVKRGKILAKGTVIRPQEIAILAALGCDRISVCSRPTVAILSTGNELISHSERLSIGKVRDSNSWVLEALLRMEGVCPKRLGIAKDTRQDLRKKIREGLRSDILLVAGGVSVGTHDLVKSVFKELGIRQLFWKVKMKPGKPVFMGNKGKTLVFGLPGNPASGFVAFEVFVRPAIHGMAGRSDIFPVYRTAVAVHPLKHRKGKVDFLRGIVTKNKGGLLVRSAGRQGSHCFKSLCQANALIRLPENILRAARGDKVEVLLLWGGSF
ncbi:MAG: hypothetical protein A2351_08165 [Omnitrophica bacterium RIFOXYB12_FULL_50_7]|nr:MAG: hypothetical protein A2351_08165 [Omnitrophica bacterium RIFOXYB12_FULL_50_7]